MPMGKQKNFPPPLKRWSQNFLQDKNMARKIIDQLEIEDPEALVLEIGPGQGILTDFLLKKTRNLVVVEIDKLLAAQLKEKYKKDPSLKILNEDILKLNLRNLLSDYTNRSIYFVGNLPYHITSPILFKILDESDSLKQSVFMVQKEMARRICASPGNKIYGILSVFCQFHAAVEYLFTVPARLFFPRPKVDSAVIRLNFHNRFREKLKDEGLFRKIVRRTFNQRRKMLRNTLSELFNRSILGGINIDLSRRPETLSVEEFISMTNQIFEIISEDKK
jgi:16S rRNA (adenine1518-N6/adenine1519-N6)-dimethyltransferase